MADLSDLNQKNVMRICFTGAVAIYLALVVATALTKAPINDEGWYGQPAFRLAAGKTMGTPAIENAGVRRFQGVQTHTYWIMPLFIVAQAGMYKVVGSGLVQMRLLSGFWGLVFILSWYLIIRGLLRDRMIATLAVIFIALDFQIITVCATGRSDAMCAGLGAAGLAVYLTQRNRSLAWATLFSHCLIVASGLTHPYGFYYFVALAYLMFYLDRGLLTWRNVAPAVIPYGIGAVLWGSYILKAPADFIAQFGNNASERSWVLKHPVQALIAELGRYQAAYGLSSASPASRRLEIVILLAYVAGVIGVLATRSLRQNPRLRPLLILLGLFFLELTFLEGAKRPWYLIHLIPWLAVLLAVIAMDYWRVLSQSMRVLLATGIAGMLMVNTAVTLGMNFRDGYHAHYVRLVEFLQQPVPEQGRVMGGAELGFGLGFDNVKDDYKLGFYSGWRPARIVIGESYRAQFDLFRQRRPELWRYVQHRLADEYVKVFDDGSYAVYSVQQTPTALVKPGNMLSAKVTAESGRPN